MTGLLQALAARRKELGLSQAEAARRAGLTTSQVSRIESGAAAPKLASVEALAGALETALVLAPLDRLTEIRRFVVDEAYIDLRPARPIVAAAVLRRLGGDLPGAVVISAPGNEAPPSSLLPALASTAGGEANHEMPRVRFSLAGMQLKFSAMKRGERLTAM